MKVILLTPVSTCSVLCSKERGYSSLKDVLLCIFSGNVLPVSDDLRRM